MRRAALLVAAFAVLAPARAAGLYDHLYDPGALPVAEVIGMEVLTPEGRLLGRIHDVLFDRTTGRIASIVLERAAATHPVNTLLAADKPGAVIAEPALELSSAGATALRAAPVRTLSPARGQAFFIDLKDGRIRPPPQ